MIGHPEAEQWMHHTYKHKRRIAGIREQNVVKYLQGE